MRVKFIQPFGDGFLELEDELKDEKGIFKFGEFVNSIPRTGPGGALDLRFSHRTGKDKKGIECEFYEIVCDSAGMRYCYGQRTAARGGGLFKRDDAWEPVFNRNGQDDREYDQHDEPTRREAPPASRPAATAQAAVRPQVASSPLGKQIVALKLAAGINDKDFLALVDAEYGLDADTVAGAVDCITEDQQTGLIQLLKSRLPNAMAKAA